MEPSPAVATLERVEAILCNEAIYELADRVPRPSPELGGRPRAYPGYMLLVFDALLSVYRSGRQVEAELSHPVVWRFMRRVIKKRFPNDPSKHLPSKPMLQAPLPVRAEPLPLRRGGPRGTGPNAPRGGRRAGQGDWSDGLRGARILDPSPPLPDAVRRRKGAHSAV